MSAPPFKTALQLKAEADAAHGLAAGPASQMDADLAPSALVVAPEMSTQQAFRTWNAFLQLRDEILGDPACYDVIDGSKQMNRTGATRLALPFGLSIEERGVSGERVQMGESDWDFRWIVRIRVGKGQRYVDGIGSCRLSEITTKSATEGQKEHFALTKAWTRATKRAIADILGGTDAD